MARKNSSFARTGFDVPPDVHIQMDVHTTNKTLLKSEALYQYILDTTVLPNEPECMRELRVLTDKHQLYVMSHLVSSQICYLSSRTCLRPCRRFMASSPDEAQLLGMLVKLTGAKNTIEVGVYTGHSLLATALALPDDGKVIAIDTKREDYDQMGRQFVEKAGVEHKVDFREGTGLDRLEELLADDGNLGRFDMAFVDADKPNYVRYHEQLLRLVRVGGIIVYDNTLWGGAVALPEDAPMTDFDRWISTAIKDLNARLAVDTRIKVCQLAVADGVTICRRVV
ncbi:hypothetical protein EJB05_49487 [Eragrostis curvula]|uniref:Caffeoyl-CoA O-methyltransferase n=1 Tax=Eragrostis curvula TaxID=38414 RepID=A0A5J9T4M3_9POAL|nr:hypothetical protein EJB05_49487 [Eragrostis curvula]